MNSILLITQNSLKFSLNKLKLYVIKSSLEILIIVHKCFFSEKPISWNCSNKKKICQHTYKILNTPFETNIIPSFVGFHFIPQWFRQISCKNERYSSSEHICQFDNNHKLLVISYNSDDDLSQNTILETYLIGLPNSLFETHYPKGINISKINHLFEPYTIRDSQLNNIDALKIYHLFPFILSHTIGTKIKYPKESLTIRLLLDDTFDVEVLKWNDSFPTNITG